MSSFVASLFYVLTHSLTLWPEAYECPENLNKPGTSWPIYGTYLIVSGVIFITLYIPCFIAIVRTKTRIPAYQLMLILGILDLISLCINSLVTGYLAINGITFCQYPLFMFIIGAIAKSTWMTICLACILLAIERCVEVNSGFPLAFIFGKRTFRAVMTALMIYWVYTLLFNAPPVYIPEYAYYSFDPMIGKDPALYVNVLHNINNPIVAISTTFLYFYLCYYLIFKYGYSTSMWLYKSKRQIILQGVIICFFHAGTAIIYEFVQFFYTPQWLILAGQIFWQWSSGSLSIVYLSLNRSIRNSVIKMIIPKKTRISWGIHIGADEHVALEQATAVNSVAVKFDNFFQK